MRHAAHHSSLPEISSEYRKASSSEIWHFCSNCSGWPPLTFVLLTDLPAMRRSVASVFLKDECAKVPMRAGVKKTIRNLDHGVGIPLPPSNRADEGYQSMPTPPRQCKSAGRREGRNMDLENNDGCKCPRCDDHIPEQFYCRNCGYVPNWRQKPHEQDESYKVAA